MSLPWIQLHASVTTHRKSIELAALLDDPDAWRFLIKLWLWASQNEPTGAIKGAAARMVVEHVCGWRGESGKLTDALVASGWLDVSEDGLHIHDWDDHQGAHIEKSRRDVERIRAKRQASSGRSANVAQTSREQSAVCSANVARTTGEQPGSVAQTSRDVPATFAVRGDERRGEEKREEATPTPLVEIAAQEPEPLLRPVDPDSSSLQAIWNDNADDDLPRWKETSTARKKSTRQRLKEKPDLDYWREVVSRINASDFCRGRNNTGWRASPDWLLQPDTASKVLEGKYNNRTGTAKDVKRGRVGAEETDWGNQKDEISYGF